MRRTPLTEPSRSLSRIEQFAALEDPRVERTKVHPLVSIVVSALCAVLCGAESWDEIAAFGEAKQTWRESSLDLPNGFPSHDTSNRVFAALDPKQFQACFVAWMQTVAQVLPTQIIAIDGKTVRGSRDRANGKAAIHRVSAWASANRLVLAQVKVDDKSNEITAISELLHVLAIKGCRVTSDAMGCQREIARQIVEQGGDYILALKENQETLYTDVVGMFAGAQAKASENVVIDANRSVNKGHGRIEVRRGRVITDPDVLAGVQEEHQWPGLQAIGMGEAERRLGDERSRESRYYLLSAHLTAKAFGEATRSHGGIANQVHWVLDVAFHEDQSRIRHGHAAENFTVLRHLALNLLRQQQTKRLGIRGRRLKAAWDHDFLLQIIKGV